MFQNPHRVASIDIPAPVVFMRGPRAWYINPEATDWRHKVGERFQVITGWYPTQRTMIVAYQARGMNAPRTTTPAGEPRQRVSSIATAATPPLQAYLRKVRYHSSEVF